MQDISAHAQGCLMALTMSGGGVFGLAPGQITDDGELTLALARALTQADPREAAGNIYPRESVASTYRAWMDSPPFDVGQATRAAMGARPSPGESLAEAMSRAAGVHNPNSKANGALMRSTPMGIRSTRLTIDQAVQAARADAMLSGGGDTDTNACIVGGLVGARLGIEALPSAQVSAVVRCDTALGRPRPDWLSAADAHELARALLA
ncbi:MAG: ADP-ribosylglycohydrolase family protein [Burkholderiaceae bacterium]